MTSNTQPLEPHGGASVDRAAEALAPWTIEINHPDGDWEARRVSNWDPDERDAYRSNGGFQEGNAAVQAIRRRKAADAVLSSAPVATLRADLSEALAQRDALRAQLTGPAVTRYPGGQLTATWPEGADRTLITRDVLDQVIRDLNGLRAVLAEMLATARWREGEGYQLGLRTDGAVLHATRDELAAWTAAATAAGTVLTGGPELDRPRAADGGEGQ